MTQFIFGHLEFTAFYGLNLIFEKQKYLVQSDELFIIYSAKGKIANREDIDAEVISYLKFKDNQVIRIHGHVHLLKGNPADMDMNDSY